jgi:hypothetical protein
MMKPPTLSPYRRLQLAWRGLLMIGVGLYGLWSLLVR